MSLLMQRGAEFSDDRRYRYLLWRIWNRDGGYLAAIGLNPSTADEYKDDATMRVLIKRTRMLGYGGFYMLNLFPWRDTHPSNIPQDNSRFGPDGTSRANDECLYQYCKQARMVVACWGSWAAIGTRAADVCAQLLAAGVTLHALELTKDGAPRHPLRIPYAQQPFIWRRPGMEKAPARGRGSKLPR